MSWLKNRILTGNLIFGVPTMTLFQNFEKLEIVLSTDVVNLASHDGTLMRTQFGILQYENTSFSKF